MFVGQALAGRRSPVLFRPVMRPSVKFWRPVGAFDVGGGSVLVPVVETHRLNHYVPLGLAGYRHGPQAHPTDTGFPFSRE